MGGLNELRAAARRFAEVGGIKAPMTFMLPYLGKYWGTYAGLLALLGFGIGSTLFFAWFLKNVTDAAVAGDLDRFVFLLPLGAAYVALNSAYSFFNTLLQARAVQRIKTDLKNDLFRHMLRLPSSLYEDRHSGKLVSHLTHDINHIDGAIGGNLLRMLRLPLTAIGAFAYLAYLNAQLALLCLLLAPPAALAGIVFGKTIRAFSRTVHEEVGRQTGFLSDSFAGYTVIKSFSLEASIARKYAAQSDNLLALEMKLARLRGWFQAGAGGAGALGFFLSLGAGAYFVAIGQLSVGSLLAFVSLMQYLINPLMGMAALWGAFQRSVAAIERLQAVMNEPIEPYDPPAEHCALPAPPSAITWENVSFGYDGSNFVLKRIQLHVQAGQVVALAGPSGAGKSTFMRLLLGLYAPQEGVIAFDRTPIDRLPVSELRRHVAYVPQEPYLFAGTIRDNLRYGREDANEREIVRAAKEANAHPFIMELPNGYDTEVGERGAQLSGGQRQRIAIARALLKDAPILLLDEATSALDGESEKQVQNALERLMRNRTTFVIAHRLSTIQRADLIVVLNQGRIEEQGTHEELLRRGGLYARLYRSQFRDARLTLHSS